MEIHYTLTGNQCVAHFAHVDVHVYMYKNIVQNDMYMFVDTCKMHLQCFQRSEAFSMVHPAELLDVVKVVIILFTEISLTCIKQSSDPVVAQSRVVSCILPGKEVLFPGLREGTIQRTIA